MTTEATGGVHFAKVDASSNGDNTLVAAASGKRIRVLSFALVASAAVGVTIKSGSTAITGAMNMATNGVVEARAPWGCFQSAEGESLVLNLSSAVAVGGWIAFQNVE